MGSALVALATTTLASSSATVTFSSISGSYRDLRLVIVAKTTTANGAGASNRMTINSDSGSNYSYVVATGNGSTASSSANTTTFAYADWFGSPTNADGAISIVDFLDYSATDKQKTMLCRGNYAATGTDMLAVRWASTSAITSISITMAGFTYATGSTFSLFGVSA